MGSTWRGKIESVEIRELFTGEADQLVELFAAVLPESPTAHADQLDEPEAFLRDPACFVLGAYIDRSPKDWRRQGVGSALITEGMTLARRHGSTRFWLSTGGHNETAQALYDSLGGDRKPLGDVNYWWELD